MEKTIPVKNYPYTLEDLSVVIPQASQYQRRIEWFIPQYINATPPQVIKNTIVTYDQEDDFTKSILAKYNIRGIHIQPPHSTYKMQGGFDAIKTRLCVRLHNDVWMRRRDWASTLVNHFNNDNSAQMVGFVHQSGGIGQDKLEKLLSWYPVFKSVYESLEFSNNAVGSFFYAAQFMASQTYVFRGLYSLVVDFNEGKMDKEDVVTTLFAMLHKIKLTHWANMGEYVKDVGASYGDFDEGFQPVSAIEEYPIQPVFHEFTG